MDILLSRYFQMVPDGTCTLMSPDYSFRVHCLKGNIGGTKAIGDPSLSVPESVIGNPKRGQLRET